ncbi:hypothetical protein BaRGS_00012487, partial [Batillaria attramentaria]
MTKKTQRPQDSRPLLTSLGKGVTEIAEDEETRLPRSSHCFFHSGPLHPAKMIASRPEITDPAINFTTIKVPQRFDPRKLRKPCYTPG